MSLRQHLKFHYPISKLLPLCKANAEYHRTREKVYRDKFVEAEKDLKENGIRMLNQGPQIALSGSIGNLGSYSNYNGGLLTPSFDPEKVKEVENCKSKINHHQSNAEQYEKFVKTFNAALSVRDSMELEIDGDDVVFFHIEV